MRLKPLVALTRDNKVENIHSGYVCIVDTSNNVLYSIGDVNTKIYIRSSAKPFIGTAIVKSGALERFNIDDKELAIICSSHSGEEMHLDTMRSLINKLDISEDSLNCGVAEPYDKDMIDLIKKNNQRPSKLHNCCSGKHAGIIAACKTYGYPIDDYYDMNHPFQNNIQKCISTLLNIEKSEIIKCLDNCNLPGYMISVQQLSYLYALLADADNLNNEYKESMMKVKYTMMQNPEMVGGSKEFVTDLMLKLGKRIVAKVGDDGIYGIAIPEKKIGIVVKIADGIERGCYSVITNVLKQLNLISEDEFNQLFNCAFTPIKNNMGEVVGYTLPLFNIIKSQTNELIKIGDILEFKGE